jgi:hypothetical protein
MAWAQAGAEWQSVEPFAETAHHTMSFDWAILTTTAV